MLSDRKSRTHFLNVDLDLGAQGGLDALIAQFGSAIIVLNNMPSEASLELGEDFGSLDETVVGWLDTIEAFPVEARGIWDRCEFRKLNIGIQAGTEPHAAVFALSRDTVSRLTAMKLELVVTVYAYDGARA